MQRSKSQAFSSSELLTRTHGADLVLDLALLPAGRRRAGDRLHQVMAAHPQEPAVVGAFLAHKDRVDRRLRVYSPRTDVGSMDAVVDPARARPFEEGESPVVGVEHHLLALAGDNARTNSVRLWQSRTCATFTVTVTPLISTISWLQSNWWASPGAKLSGTKAAAVAADCSRRHAAAYLRTAS